MSKPYVCLPCGTHFGGLLLNMTDLTHRTCRKCRKKLSEGFTAFCCSANGKTIWINPTGGVSDQYRGTVIQINLEQYEKLTGKKEP